MFPQVMKQILRYLVKLSTRGFWAFFKGTYPQYLRYFLFFKGFGRIKTVKRKVVKWDENFFN